jgi:hypothetical protein
LHYFRGLALLMSAAGLFLMAYLVPAVFAFEVGHNPVTTDVQTIRSISSPAMRGAFYIYMGILTDDQEQLSFEYPDPILQVGQQYTFTTYQAATLSSRQFRLTDLWTSPPCKRYSTTKSYESG